MIFSLIDDMAELLVMILMLWRKEWVDLMDSWKGVVLDGEGKGHPSDGQYHQKHHGMLNGWGWAWMTVTPSYPKRTLGLMLHDLLVHLWMRWRGAGSATCWCSSVDPNPKNDEVLDGQGPAASVQRAADGEWCVLDQLSSSTTAGSMMIDHKNLLPDLKDLLAVWSHYHDSKLEPAMRSMMAHVEKDDCDWYDG